MMYILLALMVGIVVATMAYGFVENVKGEIKGKKKIKKALKINIGTFAPIASFLIICFVGDIVKAAGTTGVTSATGLGYLGAALSTGLATIGAGYAVGAVGSSALGAVSEDQSILGKTLIFVGLGEGIAIYGLIISIMILSKLG